MERSINLDGKLNGFSLVDTEIFLFKRIVVVEISATFLKTIPECFLLVFSNNVQLDLLEENFPRKIKIKLATQEFVVVITTFNPVTL